MHKCEKLLKVSISLIFNLFIYLVCSLSKLIISLLTGHYSLISCPLICFTFLIFWTFCDLLIFLDFCPPPRQPPPTPSTFLHFGPFDFCNPPSPDPPALPCAHSFTSNPPLFNFLICCPFYFFSTTHTLLTPHPRPDQPLPPFRPCTLDPPIFTFFELWGFFALFALSAPTRH